MSDAEEPPLFGIDSFKFALFEILPEVAQYRFARTAKLAEKASKEMLERLDKQADKIIGGASLGSGTSCRQPCSGFRHCGARTSSNWEIVRLGATYGKTIDRNSAMEVVATLGAGLAARTVFQGIVSLIPVVKNVLGPPVAAAATYGIGKAATAYFKGPRGALA